MKTLLRLLTTTVVAILSTCSILSGQPDNFDILIKRNRVMGNLVYCSIYLNGQEIGAAYENNDLKIPTGSYKGQMRYNSGKNFVQSPMGQLSTKGDFLLEVAGVSGRTDILLHQGNQPKHSLGCILLGPAKKGPSGGVLIEQDHPLRKLRIAFYGTDEPISCPDKNITITVTDDFIKSFRANGNSGTIQFGGGGYCTYSIQMQNVNFLLSVNGQNNTITNIQLSCDAVEGIVGSCPYPPIARNRHNYNQAGGGLNGNSFNINFNGTGSPKCSARFIGTLSENGISGTISWTRIDIGPPFNYTVTMPVNITN